MADNLRAVFINCTLKRSRETSLTQMLMKMRAPSCWPTGSRCRQSAPSTARSRPAWNDSMVTLLEDQAVEMESVSSLPAVGRRQARLDPRGLASKVVANGWL